ncbi:sigma-70 family RNA polymerase sigma factor [Flammeovirga sp. MY04]|nr:sigma-70 family RNA polymerase sigma factor [Flammeovirga sp. MY04]
MKTNMIDLHIWSRVREGDYEAFEQLYDLFFDSLYAYGIKLCKNSDQVEDAIHDMFLDIWKYHDKLSETTSVKFYLFRSLRRKIHKNIKSDEKVSIFNKDVTHVYEVEDQSFDTLIIQSEEKAEKSVLLKKNLASLSKRQYEAVMLKFYSNFSYKEIGSMMDMNEQSARNLIGRGLEKLKGLFS